MTKDVTSKFIRRSNLHSERFALLFLAVFYSAFLWLQEGIVDTADGVLHYQYARFAFDHPENLFHHWAKPVFTLLAALPAQAGLIGVKAMNIVIVLVTASYAMKAAKLLQIKEWFLAGLFSVMGNSVLYVVLGGLTEPTMMLAFSATLYFAASERFKSMYFVLGMSLLIRPEAIVVILVFGLYGLFKRQWKSTVYALLFPVMITLAGMWVADYEWSWIVTQQPYNPAGSIYGSGEWLHYLKRWNNITPYTTLFLAGAAAVHILVKRKSALHYSIILSAFGILLLHVLLWKFGKMGSAGLVRTLTTALPGFALLAAYALSLLPKRGFVMLILCFYGLEFFAKLQFPQEVNDRERAAKEMALKVKERGLLTPDNKVAYQFATTAFYLDLDPFDTVRVRRLWVLDDQQASKSLNNGDVLIWDNQTGNREGKLPWTKISSDPHARKVDSIHINGVTLVSFRIEK